MYAATTNTARTIRVVCMQSNSDRAAEHEGESSRRTQRFGDRSLRRRLWPSSTDPPSGRDYVGLPSRAWTGCGNGSNEFNNKGCLYDCRNQRTVTSIHRDRSGVTIHGSILSVRNGHRSQAFNDCKRSAIATSFWFGSTRRCNSVRKSWKAKVHGAKNEEGAGHMSLGHGMFLSFCDTHPLLQTSFPPLRIRITAYFF